jgi:hypothetical protein
LEPPQLRWPRPNSASRITRRKTSPLERAAGVLRAATHKGSINCSRTRGVSLRVSSATLCAGGQRKRASCQPAAARSSDSLSAQVQPRAARIPAAASQGAGHSGSANPLPCTSRSTSGRRSSTSPGRTPTFSISRKVST